MGMVFKIMAFVFMVNIAAGLLNNAGVGTGGVVYDSTKGNSTFTEYETGVDPTQVRENTNFFDNLLNIITFGLYEKIKNFLYTALLGLPKILIGAGLIDEGIHGVLVGLMLFIYVLGGVEFLTGRRLNK